MTNKPTKKPTKNIVRLNIGERFALLGILPEKGDFTKLKIVRELREKLSFTEAEHKEYGISQVADNKVKWNPKKAGKDKGFEFGGLATALFVEALKKLDEKKELKLEHFSVYEKFVN